MKDIAAAATLEPDGRPSPGLCPPPAETDGFIGRLRATVDFAFQPIVNVHTGKCHGVEALLRGSDAMGFESIGALFDHAFETRMLHRVDLALRDMAAAKFARLAPDNGLKLFFNLDNRILSSPDYRTGSTQEILCRHGLTPTAMCFEISERHEAAMESEAEVVIDTYRRQSYRLAIDDFGTGYSGLKLLYQYQPDYLKIDRFFISGMARDAKKSLMVSAITDLAHILGIRVIAEGVETEKEFHACKSAGCDFIQGWFIDRPQTVLSNLHRRYEVVREASRRDRRRRSEAGPDQRLIYDQIEFMPPLKIDEDMDGVFEAFRRNKRITQFPVVDDRGEPCGVVREQDLKEYAYSPFGKDLIANRSCGKTLASFITPCPVADIRTEAEKILETYSLGESGEGVIMVRDGVYVGFLSTASLLRVINEKNLATARDQNPLTRLPGNLSIDDYLSLVLDEPDDGHVLVYFDFDNFKPFNDGYGFRQGDRAILLFAELMRKHLAGAETFLAHIGGDDFFAGFKGDGLAAVERRVGALQEAFRRDVESFYSPEAREAGCLSGVGRDGSVQCFPLLSVSAAVIEVPQYGSRAAVSADELVSLISRLKKRAKAADGHLAAARLGDTEANSPSSPLPS